MPLSAEQRRIMNIHLRSKTAYDGAGTNHLPDRTLIIGCIEFVLDNEEDCQCDLYLPNSFIVHESRHDFWFKMAGILCSGLTTKEWHALEYGVPLSREDHRQRYVYTWHFDGSAYKFFTKVLNDGYRRELVWYFGKMKDSGGIYLNDDIDSSNETDSDEIIVHTL